MSLFKSFWSDNGSPHDDAAASRLIPPPTVSTLLERSRSPQSPDHHASSAPYDPDDPMLPLQRAETALQRQLQDLLDAQTRALFPHVTQSDAEMSSSRIAGALPRRQPPPQSIPLAEARDGIAKAMLNLSRIKSRQSIISEKRGQDIQTAVDMVESWRAKERDLNSEIDAVKQSSNDEETKRLKEEDQSLQDQINAMEMKLFELKSQKRIVKLKLSEKSNAVSSNIASFQESLALLESQKRNFLRRPPRDLFRSLPTSSFLALRPERRSAQLAYDALKEAQDAESHGSQAIKEEQEALDDGASIWSDIVRQATLLESAIRSELTELAASPSDPASAEQGMDRLLERLEATITSVETKLNDSESKGRSLLVCCIGAELEALKNGREILKQSLHAARAGASTSGAQHTATSPEEPSSGGASPVHAFRGRPHASAGSTTSESDADPQNLLISNNDTDTD